MKSFSFPAKVFPFRFLNFAFGSGVVIVAVAVVCQSRQLCSGVVGCLWHTFFVFSVECRGLLEAVLPTFDLSYFVFGNRSQLKNV